MMLLHPDSFTPSIPKNSANPLWEQLVAHKQEFSETTIAQLFEHNPNRAKQFSLKSSGLMLDYSKNLVTEETRRLLAELAREAGLTSAIRSMFAGESINFTEDRPALHVALRGSFQDSDKLSINEEIQKVQTQIQRFVEQIETQQWLGYTGLPITDIVNIGVGGSDLGSKMVYDALAPYQNTALNVHFLANIDGSDFVNTVHGLSPQRTLFIVASKSFSTLETKKNAEAARDWVLEDGAARKDLDKHFVAISSNVKAAMDFGISEEQIFPMWDWVGGRYSLWSAIGLPLALGLGYDNFKELCSGAQQMDHHFKTSDFEENIPVMMAMLEVWYQNYFGAKSHAILPYDENLRRFPAFLQQLDMESNGKSTNSAGESLDYSSGAVIWGSSGTVGQHSFHQLLHQGTQLVPADFIVPLKSKNPVSNHHTHLFSNAIAQSQALMIGRDINQARVELKAEAYVPSYIDALAPHRVIPGNRPSNMLLMEVVTPSVIGALIALYEHKVYVQSVVWDINAFDQWGVELGKQLSQSTLSKLIDTDEELTSDSSTNELIRLFRKGSF